MNKPRVSVIIAVYNGEKFLREAIESALAQTYPCVEIIAVNDGSTDRSAEILKSYEPRIRVFHQENAGQAAARNLAISKSSGDWIGLLDQDDLWDAEKLERQLAASTENDDVLFSDLRHIDENGHVTREACRELPNGASRDLLSIISDSRGHILTTLIRRRAVERVGGFDRANRFGTDDYQLWLRLAATGHTFRYLDDVLASYRLHGLNTSLNVRRMRLGDIYALERTRHEYSQAFRSAERRAYHARLRELHFDIGWHYYNEANFQKAAWHFRRAVRHAPVHLKSWMYAAATSLPLRSMIVPKLRSLATGKRAPASAIQPTKRKGENGHAANVERRIVFGSDAAALGGAERYQTAVAGACAAAGWRAISVMPYGSASDAWASEMEARGVGVRRGYLLRMANTLVRNRCGDLILHVNSSWRANFLMVFLLAKSLGARLVLTEHTVPPQLVPARGLRRLAPWRFRLRLRTLRRRAEWRLADRIVLVGETVKRRLMPTHDSREERWMVIPNGVDARRFRPDPVAGARVRQAHGIAATCVIGSVGRLAGEKAYDLLVRAMVMLRRDDVSLLLVGDGPDRVVLVEMAKRLGIAERTHFVGWRDNINDYLNAMDIFALPSNFEAMPFSILEAMAAQLPVVATDVGGVPEMVRHGQTGYVVPPGDAAAISEALRKLVDSAELRRQFGAEARRLVEESFSEDFMIRRTLQLYDEILSPGC